MRVKFFLRPKKALCFFYFLTVHAALVFAPFGVRTKTIVFLCGVLAVAGIGMWRSEVYNPKAKLPWEKDIWPHVPGWLWVGTGLLAVGLRLWKLDTLFLWPMGDESTYGAAAIGLLDHWKFQFFNLISQQCPWMTWMILACFKVSSDPFFNLWFPPAFVSILTVGAGMIVTRRFLSRSTAFLFSALLAASFWPLWTSRSCFQPIFVPLLELLAFGCLGTFLGNRRAGGEWVGSFLLGVLTGLGFWASTAWVFVACAIGLAIFLKIRKEGLPSPRRLYGFLAGFLPSFLFFALIAIQADYGTHISAMAAWSGRTSLGQQGDIVLQYLSCFLWGYGGTEPQGLPPWGGFLNPLLAAFFFCGVIEVWKYRRNRQALWLFACLALFLMPGLLSMNMESLRIIQAFPVILFFTAVGFQVSLEDIPPFRRWFVLGLILVLSTGFDFYHLAQPFQDAARNPAKLWPMGRSATQYQAYQIIWRIEKDWGPGYVFTQFLPRPIEPSLSVMTYPFNAAENRRLGADDVHWAVVETDIHYQPFLSAMFPNASWCSFKKDLVLGDDMAFAVIPVTPQNRVHLLRWAEADRIFQRWGLEMNDISNGVSYDIASKDLLAGDPEIKGDRLLKSFYWEMLAEFYYQYGFQKHFDDQISALQRAVQEGCPASHLYYKLGSLFARRHRYAEARQAFQKAMEGPMPDSRAGEGLDFLNRLESGRNAGF